MTLADQIKKLAEDLQTYFKTLEDLKKWLRK
jgi:hypothetical protein